MRSGSALPGEPTCPPGLLPVPPGLLPVPLVKVTDRKRAASRLRPPAAAGDARKRSRAEASARTPWSAAGPLAEFDAPGVQHAGAWFGVPARSLWGPVGGAGR
jgi:hypothetical protein